ncbi:MAG: thiamine pyrophosphate-binding protein [Hyphomicrobium sp.]
MHTVADYIIRYLAACGVRHIFGYPGSPLIPLLSALQRQEQVQWILMRHENAAALAASAQAKLTGCLAVCFSTSGPGALQAVCGTVEAHLDRAPLLAFTGTVARSQQGHTDFQDVDQTSLYNSILTHSVSCASSEQLPSVLRNLISTAVKNKTAVHIALPIDILEEEISADDELYNVPTFHNVHSKNSGAFDQQVLERAAQLISTQNPIIVVGRHARNAGSEIEKLSSKLSCPMVSTLDGKGVVDESHPNYLGVLGIFGHPAVAATRRIIETCDTVISFGTDNLKAFLTDHRSIQRRKLIQCVEDFSLINQDFTTELTLLGDLKSLAITLSEKVEQRPTSHLIEKLSRERLDTMEDILNRLAEHEDANFVNPLDFLLLLNVFLDERHILSVDTGSHTLWTALFLRLKKYQPFLVSKSLGTMGFCLPALIAAQITKPHSRAVGICGDGGFSMVGMELATAVQYNLPLVLFIINNGILQNILAQQKIPFGCHIKNPDFSAFAMSFGAETAVIDGAADMEGILSYALTKAKRPMIVDVKCSPSLIMPLNKWESGELTVSGLKKKSNSKNIQTGDPFFAAEK